MNSTNIPPLASIPPHELSVSSLPGIGNHRMRVLKEIGIETVDDLLHYYPRRYLDRSAIVQMQDLPRNLGRTVTVIGTVAKSQLARGRRKRLVVKLVDGLTSMDLVFFQGVQYWQGAFSEGQTIAVSGEATMFGRRCNMVHPDIDRLPDSETLEFINTGGIIPVYPSGGDLEKVGLNRHGGFRKLLHTALKRHLTDIRDPFDAALQKRYDLIPLRTAIEQIHRPASDETLGKARRRLIFDEFFALSLQLALQKRRQKTSDPGISFSGGSPTAQTLVAQLPFELTGAQKRVLREIVDDMRTEQPMNRLLQGDVGSGKTVVALLSMLLAVDNGYQCALMVPTEILAEQHYRTITSLVNDLSINIQLLTGQQSQSHRNDILAGIGGGTVDIVVGTHALIQQGVDFNRLGFTVIDEQHRFGVMQRAVLRAKGTAPDVLVMTATPIPRTLSMTLYGDLDVSGIDELPAGRKQIRTAVRFGEDRPSIEQFIREEATQGNQVYIVFPLVTESEKLDLKAATEEYERLSAEVFTDLRIGLLHGQMKSDEKDAVMMSFKRRELDILVTTTVVEVGVDVPDATVMVVEHAERFGLAQLHQLRGRIGRSEKQGYCILMTERGMYYAGGGSKDDHKQQSDLRRRLDTMRDHLDGFKIAEVDMEIRGPGDLWGTQQSGYPEFRIANLLEHGEILQEARDAAFSILEDDPQLRAKQHEGIRTVLGPRIKARLKMAGVS